MQDKIAVISIGAILLSPLFAVLISQFIDYKREKIRRKYKVLEAIVSYRYGTDTEGFLKAYNSIPVIFKDYDKVIMLYRDSYNAIAKGEKEKITQALTGLILEICKVMGYKNVKESDIENVVGKDKREEMLLNLLPGIKRS